MDEAVQAYIDGIAPENRPLFNRLHRLIVDVYPNLEMKLSYDMPTYKVGKRRLLIGVWQHGLSIYGWGHGRDGGFVERHPELLSGKGTIRLSTAAAEAISDEELANLARAVLRPD